MTKKQVRIFPDYCSSGIWGEVGNMDESEINMNSTTSVALKYWHWVWETWDVDIPELHEKPVSKVWIDEIYRQWWEDGKSIVEAIAQQNPDLDVVYMADTPEEIMKTYYGEQK